ncbi:MAG TPA: hypothetical protein VGD98_23360 [Ktedonobacteraceae bacterium]
MDASPPRTKNGLRADDIVKASKTPVSRRDLLKLGLLGTAAATLAGIDSLAWAPLRNTVDAATAFPDIQFDIGNFLGPVQTFNLVQVHLPPVYTVFLTARLNRTPSKSDQTVLANALSTIESHYPFSPSGIFTLIAYGLPYFRRLPGGLTGSVVSNNMPRLLTDHNRYALEEAVASPTDVSSVNPGVTKATFNVPVVIESNDILFSLRSDTLSNAQNVISWLQGSNSLNGSTVASPAFSGLFTYTSMRTMFVQMSLPHFVAQQNNLSFTSRVNPDSPMWMGFADQQVAGSGPSPITTFQGNSSAHFTTATSGSYFDNGSLQHFSHVIQDLAQFYGSDEPFSERVQYMFRSDPIPALGNGDQFSNGGGPAFLQNDASVFLHFQAQGTSEAVQTAANPNAANDPQPPSNPTPADVGQRRPRMGHLSALQQSSRAADGTPIHIRMDGPGFDNMDVPGGSNQPKLQFSIFVPSAEFFRVMRVNQAALRFQAPAGNVGADDNGLERFLTATRRQNFLIPPRRHRAFPLLELT